MLRNVNVNVNKSCEQVFAQLWITLKGDKQANLGLKVFNRQAACLWITKNTATCFYVKKSAIIAFVDNKARYTER